jgi:integrase
MVGKERSRVRIGHYPQWSVKDARAQALNVLSERAGKPAPKRISFETAFQTFKQTHTSQKRASTRNEIERLIARHFLPKLRTRSMGDISATEITDITDKLIAKPGTCFHAFAAIRLIFRWAVRRKIIDRSPLEGMPSPVAAGHRDRVLTDDELREILRTAISIDTTFARLVRFLILSGQRRAQAARFRGAYINESETLLAWPATEMKGKRPHSIPLTGGMRDLLKHAPAEGYVFGARGTASPFSGFSKCKAAFDKCLIAVAPWTLHDLRRTFSTGLARLRVAPHIKEMLLSHASAKDPVEAIYDRHTYMDEQRQALELWEAKLQSLLDRE